jgi:hypothetical protein
MKKLMLRSIATRPVTRFAVLPGLARCPAKTKVPGDGQPLAADIALYNKQMQDGAPGRLRNGESFMLFHAPSSLCIGDDNYCEQLQSIPVPTRARSLLAMPCPVCHSAAFQGLLGLSIPLDLEDHPEELEDQTVGYRYPPIEAQDIALTVAINPQVGQCSYVGGRCGGG